MYFLVILSTFIFPILFNAVYFLIGFASVPARWVSWGAINVSFVMLIVASVPYYGKREAPQIGSAVSAAFGHLGIQFITGLVVIILSSYVDVSWKVPLIIHAVVGAAYLLIALGMRSANLHTAKVQQEAQAAHNIIMSIADDIQMIWRNMPEGKERKLVEKLFDSARTLRVNASSPNENVDLDIIRGVQELRIAVEENNGTLESVVNKLQRLFDQRNMLVAKKQTGR